MSALAPQIADCIVTALNGHTFSQAVIAVRTYRPDFKLTDLQSLKVSVAPKAIHRTMETRARDKVECQVDVAVQQALPGNDTDQLADRLSAADTLMGLVEEIQDFLARSSFTIEGVGAWKVVYVDGNPLYHPEHWDQLNVFTSVSTLTLMGAKGVA